MTRPPIPAELERMVLIESGHSCAIPSCKQTPVEICHIEPWSKVKEHKFENLIALCPTHHSRYDNTKEIDRKSMQKYKSMLSEGEKTTRLKEMPLKPFRQWGPDSYGASVVQVGGIGSRTITKTAYYLDEHGYIHSDECVSVNFNGPEDFMHVYCAEGYKIVSCESETGCHIQKLSDTNFGVFITDQLKNSVTIICERIKADDKKTVGILNKGKNTKIIDCEFRGFDIGVQNEGENLESKGNVFQAPKDQNNNRQKLDSVSPSDEKQITRISEDWKDYLSEENERVAKELQGAVADAHRRGFKITDGLYKRSADLIMEQHGKNIAKQKKIYRRNLEDLGCEEKKINQILI